MEISNNCNNFKTFITNIKVNCRHLPSAYKEYSGELLQVRRYVFTDVSRVVQVEFHKLGWKEREKKALVNDISIIWQITSNNKEPNGGGGSALFDTLLLSRNWMASNFDQEF